MKCENYGFLLSPHGGIFISFVFVGIVVIVFDIFLSDLVRYIGCIAVAHTLWSLQIFFFFSFYKIYLKGGHSVGPSVGLSCFTFTSKQGSFNILLIRIYCIFGNCHKCLNVMTTLYFGKTNIVVKRCSFSNLNYIRQISILSVRIFITRDTLDNFAADLWFVSKILNVYMMILFKLGFRCLCLFTSIYKDDEYPCSVWV